MEAKLFGIGAESYTAGSAEFYLGYAISRQKLLTLDAGHFHPTEVISEKISSVLLFCPGLLLHVSRPVRWDSDHVVILDDELQAIARELVRSGKLDRSTSDWTISTPASTASRPGSSARATCSRLCYRAAGTHRRACGSRADGWISPSGWRCSKS